MTIFVFISLRTFLIVLYCAQPLQHHLNLVRNLSSIENFRCLLAAPTCLLDKSHGCWMPPTVVPRDLVHCSLPSHAGIDCHLPLLMNSASVGTPLALAKNGLPCHHSLTRLESVALPLHSPAGFPCGQRVL